MLSPFFYVWSRFAPECTDPEEDTQKARKLKPLLSDVYYSTARICDLAPEAARPVLVACLSGKLMVPLKGQLLRQLSCH